MPRKKTQFTCGQCGATPSTPGIPCGWCKEQTGNKTTHSLCDRCFTRGCPVMNPDPMHSKKDYQDEDLNLSGDPTLY